MMKAWRQRQEKVTMEDDTVEDATFWSWRSSPIASKHASVRRFLFRPEGSLCISTQYSILEQSKMKSTYLGVT